MFRIMTPCSTETMGSLPDLRHMVIDTSAVIAVLRQEREAAVFASAIEQASVRRMSAVSFVETAAVVDSARDPIASRRLDEFVRRAEIIIESVTEEQAHLAREAYRDFGKGSGHRAKLNFGDCFSYALAKICSEPLLFKGEDFSATDAVRVG